MYPTSESSDLTDEQLAHLDDTFFESNPVAYWRARIDDLLRESAPIDYGAGLAASVVGYGLDERMLSATQPSEDERELRRAMDAFALRHHLAESLVRLIHAVLEKRSSGSSVWAALASGPNQGHEIVKALHGLGVDEPIPADLFLPVGYLEGLTAETSADVVDAVRMHWRWVRRAMRLLVSEGLDANVGNNKLKHGLAVRPHDELRVSFMAGAPRADGGVRLSDVRSGSSIIDARSIEFLQKLPSRHEHAGTWEVTVLNLRPAPLIAEALMLCTVWSAVYATAAAQHFDGQDKVVPKHPGLILGPPPEALVKEVIGYRQALTISPKSGTSRGLVVETPQGIIGLTLRGPGISGVIVDN